MQRIAIDTYFGMEAFRWPVGLERKLKEAKPFYGVLAVATLIGLMINFTKTRSDQSTGLGGNHQRGYGGASDVFYDADGLQSKDHR
jgi:hypothetical protein